MKRGGWLSLAVPQRLLWCSPAVPHRSPDDFNFQIKSSVACVFYSEFNFQGLPPPASSTPATGLPSHTRWSHACFWFRSRLDPAILGVTVLAWGNSLMDYINNTVRRRRSGGPLLMRCC